MIDIIIPTYKNIQGLRKTLNSINKNLLSYLTITIVDDCSNIQYNTIIQQFPFVNFYYLQTNQGPGAARQYALERTKESYLLFIDTDDIFINNQMQEQMIKTIQENPEIYIFSWSHISEQTTNICKDRHNRLHARIYSRKFLQQHYITFCLQGSRANQDVGFNRACRIILSTMDKDKHYYYSQQPLTIWCNKNKQSITRKNNNEFNYRYQNMGLAKNEIHVFQICNKNNIPPDLLQKQADEIIISMYRNIYYTSQRRPEFIHQSWEGAYYFYDKIYKNYEKTPSLHLQKMLSKFIREVNTSKQKWRKNIPINFRQFLYDIKNKEKIPELYI